MIITSFVYRSLIDLWWVSLKDKHNGVALGDSEDASDTTKDTTCFPRRINKVQDLPDEVVKVSDKNE